MDIATGVLPSVSDVRDLYEAFYGEDVITGEILSDEQRVIAVVCVASVGFGKLIPKDAVRRVMRQIKAFSVKLGKPLPKRVEEQTEAVASLVKRWNPNTAIVGEYLRQARNAWNHTKGGTVFHSTTLGTVSSDEMDILGRLWVGPDATKLYVIEKGVFKTIYFSRDRLRQYRPPSPKNYPTPTGLVANLEIRDRPSGPFYGNSHFDITTER